MMKDGQLTEAEFAKMKADAEAAVQEATQYALNQPYPSPESVYEDIWV